jgi:hypothetical protein
MLRPYTRKRTGWKPGLPRKKSGKGLGPFPLFGGGGFFFDLVEFAGRAIPPWIAVALTASGSAVGSRTQLE